MDSEIHNTEREIQEIELGMQDIAPEARTLKPETKIYYSIREVAALLRESEYTLRFWESKFPNEIKPKRNERGVRFYKEEDIEDIRMIQYFIRDCRLTLEGVHNRLQNSRKSSERQAKVVLRLKKIKAELKKLGKAMDEIERSSSRSGQ